SLQAHLSSILICAAHYRQTAKAVRPVTSPYTKNPLARQRIAYPAYLLGDTMEYLQNQGTRLPRLGLGTFRLQGDACRVAVESALGIGYRHIDTAEMYGNEHAIGDAIAASGIARKDLHVTTKVWNENLAPDAIRHAFDASLKKLKLDHFDLYLVHWPAKNMNLPAMFETLMKLKEEKRPR